jgi:hypothetical protein
MYDLTNTPNLKPHRSISPYDVLDYYAHTGGSVNRGTVVKLVSGTAGADTMPFVDAHSNTPSRATSLRAVNPWKIGTAASGDVPLGITIYDVRETNAFGEKYIYQPRYETSEQQIVISGQSVPVATRGIVEINGFSGTPGPGSGAIVGNGGILVVNNTATTAASGRVGKFLSTSGADGYALFKIEL